VTGAGGNIAADRVAKASPDGYTIGVMLAANIVVNGSLYKKPPYDPLKDLVPVTQVYCGDDWKTLYFTTRNTLGAVSLKIAGLPVPTPKKS